jgi:hypothetical protein
MTFVQHRTAAAVFGHKACQLRASIDEHTSERAVKEWLTSLPADLTLLLLAF